MTLLGSGLLGSRLGVSGTPRFIDLFDRGDGSLGNGWLNASTWQIVSGAATNTPSVGSELLTDGGFENWSSATNLTSWTESIAGTSTINQESTIVDSGTYSARFDIDSSSSGCSIRQTVAVAVGDFERVAVRVRASDDTAIIRIQSGASTTTGGTLTPGTSWTDALVTLAPSVTNQQLFLSRGIAPNASLYFDNASAKIMVPASLMTFRDQLVTGPITVRAGWNIPDGQHAGVVVCANSTSDPTSYVRARFDRITETVKMSKVVSGTVTELISSSATYFAGAHVEIRRTASTTFQLWYGDVQVGSDQTISDAGIVDNGYHGLWCTGGGCEAQGFFLTKPSQDIDVVWLGGSITGGASSTENEATSWRALTRKWLNENKLNYTITSIESAEGGTPSWYGLVRLQTDVLDYSPAVVFVDFAVNDGYDEIGDRSDGFAPTAEALIRRLWTELPSAMLVVGIFTRPEDYSYVTQTMKDVRDKWLALCTLYGLTPARFDDAIVAVVGEPYDDSDIEPYIASPGNVHPSDAGHALIAGAMYPRLATIGPNKPGTLPTRYYAESEDYERESQIRTGVDNDGETGTWSTVSTTARTSSTADSTISWTGTFCSFGFDSNNSVGAGVYAWTVDGSEEQQVDLSEQGTAYLSVWNMAYAEHTVVVRVVSGTVRINRFLAI